MSTKSTVWYDDNVHIYRDAYNERGGCLEIHTDDVPTLVVYLPEELMKVIESGVKAKAE